MYVQKPILRNKFRRSRHLTPFFDHNLQKSVKAKQELAQISTIFLEPQYQNLAQQKQQLKIDAWNKDGNLDEKNRTSYGNYTTTFKNQMFRPKSSYTSKKYYHNRESTRNIAQKASFIDFFKSESINNKFSNTLKYQEKEYQLKKNQDPVVFQRKPTITSKHQQLQFNLNFNISNLKPDKQSSKPNIFNNRKQKLYKGLNLYKGKAKTENSTQIISYQDRNNTLQIQNSNFSQYISQIKKLIKDEAIFINPNPIRRFVKSKRLITS